MFDILQEEKLITSLMLVFFWLSILIRILLGALYGKMIRETDNMAATDNKLLKQCKMKFANCYQLNNGVSNIPVFVDKFLNRLSLGPVSFGTLYHLSGQVMLLSVVCAGVGICKCITDGRMLGEILPFYIASFLGLYVYFSVSTVVDIKGKRRVLKINLVDYLENHLSARIDVTAQDMEMLYGKNYKRSRKVGIVGNSGKRTIELVPINRNTMISSAETERETMRREEFADKSQEETPDLPEEWGMPDWKTGERTQREAESRVTAEELEALLQEFLTV